MRILGIDYGDKNIGLAVSDLLGITAQGLGLYRQKGNAEDLAYFRGLVEEYFRNLARRGGGGGGG